MLSHIFTNFSVLRKRIACFEMASSSKYFPGPRLIRSKLMSTDINGKTHVKSKANSQDTGIDSSHLSSKLARKRSHIKIESVDNYDNSSKLELLKVKKECFVDTNSETGVKWEPSMWREQFQNINEMRKFRDAPVDTMGCDMISDVTSSPNVSFYYTSLSRSFLINSRRELITVTHSMSSKFYSFL